LSQIVLSNQGSNDLQVCFNQNNKVFSLFFFNVCFVLDSANVSGNNLGILLLNHLKPNLHLEINNKKVFCGFVLLSLADFQHLKNKIFNDRFSYF